ncbi:hypothetical protein ACMFMG_002234 [Clarireedia jacksonii]
MDELSAQSSPTLRSPLFLLRQSFPHTDLDLSNTLLSDSTVSMENEGTPRPATTPIKTPDSTKSQFFDLQPPTPHALNVKIEDLAKRLFSNEHLLFILQDHALFQKFSIFINKFKPHLVPALVRYLEMRKAIKAIEYANAVAQKIRWPFLKEALPAWVTYNLTNIVIDCVTKDVTGYGVPLWQDLVGNLAEVFCLTDPSVHDNPIIYASKGRLSISSERYRLTNPQNFIGPPSMGQATLYIEIVDFYKAHALIRIRHIE